MYFILQHFKINVKEVIIIEDACVYLYRAEFSMLTS